MNQHLKNLLLNYPVSSSAGVLTVTQTRPDTLEFCSQDGTVHLEIYDYGVNPITEVDPYTLRLSGFHPYLYGPVVVLVQLLAPILIPPPPQPQP
jgi:hypothetical protein